MVLPAKLASKESGSGLPPPAPPTPGPDPAALRPTLVRVEAASSVTGAMSVEDLNVYYGAFRAVRDVTLDITAHAVTALIGPSGCGKSTFLRTLNRMHEVIPGTRVDGKVRLDGTDVYDPRIDPVQLRRTIGMVFQRPNPFPTMSIYDNVVAGLKLTGRHKKAELDGIVEASLQRAALWNEVKDKLRQSGVSLSGGVRPRRTGRARRLLAGPARPASLEHDGAFLSPRDAAACDGASS